MPREGQQTGVNPECEWESRHYFDVMRQVIINQGLVAEALGDDISKVSERLNAILGTTKTEIAVTEGISPDTKKEYYDQLDRIKATIPANITLRNRNKLVIGIVEELENFVENGVMFDMLHQFDICNCKGEGPKKF